MVCTTVVETIMSFLFVARLVYFIAIRGKKKRISNLILYDGAICINQAIQCLLNWPNKNWMERNHDKISFVANFLCVGFPYLFIVEWIFTQFCSISFSMFGFPYFWLQIRITNGTMPIRWCLSNTKRCDISFHFTIPSFTFCIHFSFWCST